MTRQHPTKRYSFRHKRRRWDLNRRPARRSHRIGNRISNRISRNHENMEESNHETRDDTSDLPENANVPNPPINTNKPAPDIREMNIHDRVTYVVNAAYKAGFTSLADVFIHQLSNFSTFQAHGLDVVQSIICKPELESTRNLLRKDKKMCSYVAQWSRDIAKKEISLIVRSKHLQLESSQLSPHREIIFGGSGCPGWIWSTNPVDRVSLCPGLTWSIINPHGSP